MAKDIGRLFNVLADIIEYLTINARYFSECLKKCPSKSISVQM